MNKLAEIPRSRSNSIRVINKENFARKTCAI